jgi:serine/threonine-protein phosphatase 5
VRHLAFVKAIEVGDPPSAFADLDIDSIEVEKTYDGVNLEKEMTQEFIDDMIMRFKDGKKIHKRYVFQIIQAVRNIVYDEATMVEMEVEPNTTLTVCGDTHGQYFDLLEIFRLNGFPTDKHAYLFNGDFVDRGSWSTEIALLLYAYKWLRPKMFFLNRGNHETDDMNRVYGFEGECKAKYNERTFRLFSESFSALPLATLIGKKYLTLHGGLFSDDKTSLDDIRKLNRHGQRQPGQQGLMMEMLWTDPQPENGRGPSKRGVGLQFGPDVTKRFCENNGLEAVIRSHEVRMEGYEVEHDGKCITVFSAPKYCDTTENKGAYINIGPDLKLKYHKFNAVPHPDIKPMVSGSQSIAEIVLTVTGVRTKLVDVNDVKAIAALLDFGRMARFRLGVTRHGVLEIVHQSELGDLPAMDGVDSKFLFATVTLRPLNSRVSFYQCSSVQLHRPATYPSLRSSS